MLHSLKAERARHFRLALRIGIPMLIFVLLLSYGVFFQEREVSLTLENIIIFLGMVFSMIYLIYFALDLSRKETLLDQVTGGYHYHSFVDQLRKNPPRSLAAVQVSNLSVINEAYGVRKADELLKTLVCTLDREIAREVGTRGWIGRRNGAEFLLAIDEEPEVVEKLLERFVSAYVTLEDVDVDLAFAVIRNNIDDPEKAIEQLRDLLIQQKRFGSLINEAPVSDAQKLSEAERSVIEALERRDLSLSFRALKNLHNNRNDIYEIVVKMYGEDGSVIAPRDFLPIINRHNLGERYDLLIVDRVLEVMRLVDDSISLSFNLSPFSLRRKEFLDAFEQRLRESGVHPPRLIVELYERKSHHRLEEYLKRLKVLKRWGVRLCLDNFGSSNASMEYIRHFPFDMIQFDREYTFDLEEGKSLSILRSFISMAKEMRILTAAKWVDSQDKVERLRELGVDYIQGFAAGKLLREEEFITLHNPIKESK